MSDLQHIQGKYTSFELVQADVERDGFRLEKYEVPEARPFKRHNHAVDETVYVLRGSMTFTVNGTSYTLNIGDKLHLPAGTFHSVFVEDNTEYVAGWNDLPK
jgi:quercetin dioxygenase-like cupin family protein